MDIAFVILGILLLLTGIAGSIIPVLPGPPISLAGLILLRFTRFVEPDHLDSYKDLLWIFAAIAVVVTILDFYVPVWGAKKFGSSKAGVWGAALGVLIGLFFGPPGLIIGPFLGAFVGELLVGKDQKASLKAGLGSLIGFLFGVAMKLSVSFLMSFYFFRELFSS